MTIFPFLSIEKNQGSLSVEVLGSSVDKQTALNNLDAVFGIFMSTLSQVQC